MGRGGGGEGDYIPTLHCHHQNDLCITMAWMKAILMFR